MVVIRGFTEVPAPARSRRGLSHADCLFDVFEDDDLGRVLELATTGSDDRVSAGKRSQTIQLDRGRALTLLGLLEEAFGEDLYAESAGDGLDGVRDAAPERAGPIDMSWPSESIIVLPHVRHGSLAAVPEASLDYKETPDGALVSGRLPGRSRSSAELNRAIEKSAIELVKRAFDEAGWTFHADRQADGVGYDLEFVNGGQRRKVEVKGIKGAVLAFNVTPKEFWRAQEDPEFVLVAVTGALDECRREVHVVSREELVRAQRVPLSYRVGPIDGSHAGTHACDAAAAEDQWR